MIIDRNGSVVLERRYVRPVGSNQEYMITRIHHIHTSHHVASTVTVHPMNSNSKGSGIPLLYVYDVIKSAWVMVDGEGREWEVL